MRILLTGASGQLAAYLIDSLIAKGHELVAWSGTDSGSRGVVPLIPVELTNAQATLAGLTAADPDLIIHAAAISSTEAVRRDPERGRAVNVLATARLADWCASRDRRLVFTSTDMVFDGSKPWRQEDDPAEPILAYGMTKREAERIVLTLPRGLGLVARVSLLYGPSRCGRATFFDETMDSLRSGRPQTLFEDEFRTPIDFRTAADALVRLAESNVNGLVHVAGTERVSRWELVRRLAAASGLDPALVRPNRRSDVPLPEPRPADLSLDTSRLASWLPNLHRPTMEDAVRQWPMTDGR